MSCYHYMLPDDLTELIVVTKCEEEELRYD